MRFVKKSIIRKLFVSLVLFGLFIFFIGLYFYYSQVETVPYYAVLIALGIFLIGFLLIYWVDVVRPLRLILAQIQALLSGDSYKRVYTTRVDEIGVIAHFFNKVTKGLGEMSFNIIDRDRMLDELTIASQLQREILPKETVEVPGLQIVAKSRPATEVGGDSFDFVTVRGKTYVYVGDVTGHGAAAGLIMTMANAFVDVFADSFDSAFEIVVNVNKYIKQRIKKAMFMTMLMLCWDHEKQKLTYVGAGHEHLLVYRADTGVCETILAGGVALGMVPDNSKLVSEREIKLGEGDLVILYTDGITEAKNSKGKLYGIDRLKRTISEYASRYSAEGVNYYIAKDVSAFIEGHGQDDDMTLIVIRRDKGLKGEKQKIQDRSTEWKEDL